MDNLMRAILNNREIEIDDMEEKENEWIYNSKSNRRRR